MSHILNPYRFAAADVGLPELFWFDAADAASITSLGGAVSGWADRSIRGVGVAQPTGVSKPTTAATTKNGLNVLDFDGGDHLAATTPGDWKFTTDGTLWTFYAVAKYNSGTMAIATTGPLTVAAQWSFLADNGSAYNVVGNGAAQVAEISSTGWAVNTWSVVAVRYDLSQGTPANRASLNVEGGAVIANNIRTGTPSTGNPTDALNIGRNSNGSFFLTGSIGELRGYSGLHDNARVASIIAELNTKWAVY